MRRKMVKVLMSSMVIGCLSFSMPVFASAAGTVSLEDQVSTLESEKAALQDQVDPLESEKAALEDQVEQLESEKAVLEDKVKALESENGEEGSTEALQTEVVGTEYTDSSIVQIVQKALNDNGFDCGTPDGVPGSKTSESIKMYQKEKGINVNGVITDELLESLGVADKVKDAAEKESQMKDYSSEYTYTQIARDPDSYSGKKMTFKGKVLQEGDAGSGLKYVRLAINSDYDQVMFITYASDVVEYRILDDDIITIYGSCLGDYSYETVMGATVTIPWINADIIDMSDVAM